MRATISLGFAVPSLAGAPSSANQPESVESSATLSANSWLIWQLADSAFPTGGFAQSSGLESAWQHGTIQTRDDLVAFLEAALRHAGRGSVPYLRAGFSCVPSGEFPPEDESFWLQRLVMVDRRCDAFISNHVANRASRLQGQAFLTAAERAFGGQRLQRIRAAFRNEDSRAHFAPVFGAVAATFPILCDHAAELFLFIQLRGWIASAVRLAIVGPLEAQGIQHRVSSYAQGVAKDCASLGLEDAAQTAPIIELLQANQDRLYSRLFQS